MKVPINASPLMPGHVLGRGIVARRNIAARSVVDVSPVLVMPLEDVDAIKSTGLFHYT